MQYVTVQLFEKDVDKIQAFCDSCKDRGFTNNQSLKAMKFEWCLEQGGSWWGTFREDNIVSLSGIHPFKDGWRGIFRGAQIEPRPTKGLDRHQKSSQSIWSQLPLQIKFAENISGELTPIYITTNINFDASGYASRVHNLFKILAKDQIIDYVGDEEIFYTMQTVWKVNREKYYEVLGS